MRIVMEKMDGGSLWDFLHHQLKEDATSCMEDGKDAQWSLRLRIALDVARGVEAMHNHSPPIIHRDLKSPNILVISFSNILGGSKILLYQLTANRRAKIADLGTALVVLPHLKKLHAVSEPRWKAPEIMFVHPVSFSVLTVSFAGLSGYTGEMRMIA